MGHLRPNQQTDLWDNPPPLASTHECGSVALTAVASTGEAYDSIRVPPFGRGSTPGYCTYYRPDLQTTYEWWDIDPSTGARHHTPRSPAPSRPARALDDRRAGSPRARTRTTAIVSDTPKDRVHGGQLKSRAAACSTTRRCLSTAQSTTRRLVRQAPRAASLALSGAPTGRHQWSANAHDDSPTQKAQLRSRSHNGSARHHGRRDQDRQQMAVMNAANSSKGMTERAAIRRLGNDGKRARRVRIRHSEQRLRARVRRTIRAQWNLNFALRRSLPGFADVGRSKRRPCSSCCWYCRCRSVRSLDGAIRTLVPMRSRSAWCWCATQRTIHARWCQARPPSMRRAAPPKAARGRPQAARRHRVTAACCLLRVVCRTSSAAGRPLQLPFVRCNRRRSSASAVGRHE
jgi:hypothetical protein